MGFWVNNNIQLPDLFEKSVDLYPNHIALVCHQDSLSYQELDERANQLAHFFIDNGIIRGSIVGILLERSLKCYLTILALLKIGAVYVPIEVEYPDDRINHILGDLPFHSLIISSAQVKRSTLKLPKTLLIDESLAAPYPKTRPLREVQENQEDSLCYIIYTSGSTGKPKGVKITHQSVCHYIQVASEVYLMSSKDRVYQGFSLAFDASLEEIWMAFANGAALIACTDKNTRSGLGLLEFLQEQKITVFSTVPTLLSSLEDNQNDLRLLILGGETCNQNLVQRWARPGLRIINTYGPTEATVVTTWSECDFNQEITIGKPLPGYEVHLLDDDLKPVEQGQIGELCIGGIGLAKGYVNLPEITAAKFINNPTDPSTKLYRTGDIAYLTSNGDIQFSGRKDSQVKLRGFRIELNEIEMAIMQYQAISQAVVNLQNSDNPHLVAYLLIDKNADFNDSQLQAFLRTKLPDFMIPSVFIPMDAFPLLSSGKVDRKALPQCQHNKNTKDHVAPNSSVEEQIGKVWESAIHEGPISVVADFFHDLGGHSLLAAKIISNLRKIKNFESLSVLDLYQNPTIRQLAAKIQKDDSKKNSSEVKPASPKHKAKDSNYFLCGIGQFFSCLFQYGIGAWQFLVLVLCYNWLYAHQSHVSLEAASLFITLLLATPLMGLMLVVIAKWLILGRVKPGEYPLWGWFYFRWWLVRGLQRSLFQTKFLIGTPLINFYYRLLGAKIGSHCYIGTDTITVPDMLCVGDSSTISDEAKVMGYIVEDGWLKIGNVTIGNECYIGSRSVLNIHTQMEDYSVLDDMSMLPSGTTIGQHEFFAGSPATQTKAAAHHVTLKESPYPKASLALRINYSFLHYFAAIFIMMIHLISFLPGLLILSSFYQYMGSLGALVLGAPIAAAALILVHLAVIYGIKKLILRKPKSGTYPLYSIYYLRQWMVSKLLDTDEFSVLGDSLFYPMMLRLLGAKLGKKVELGESSHLIPDFIHIETGGFAASSVAFSWPSVYKGHVTYGHSEIKKEAFIGNGSYLPQGMSIGENGLLGCMTIPPSDGRASEANTYWLGSPPMYLPTREMQHQFPDSVTYNPSKRLYCLRMVIEMFRVILPSTCTFIFMCSLYSILESLLTHTSLLTTVLILPFLGLGLNLLITSGLIGLKLMILGKIKPCIKPLWDVFIWKNDIREFSCNYYINQHVTTYFLGTPFIAFLYRAMGSKIGKRVFIDTDHFAEFDLISVGDEVCINSETLIQTHLYEDRIFKLDRLTIKNGCNVGIGSIVLYNTVMEENSTLGSFSLLMKGECLPINTCWAGCPAQTSSLSSKADDLDELVENVALMERSLIKVNAE